MSNYTIGLSTIDSENIQVVDVEEEKIDVIDQDNVSVNSEIVDETNIDVDELKVFYSGEVGDSDYNNLQNKPFLDTTSEESLTPTKEIIKSTINLHKVSKTGSYNDLIDKPTKLSDFDNDKDFADKQFVLDNAVGGKIDSISVNGEKIEPVDKNVNIETPTKISDLQNDLGFIDSTVDNLFNYYSKNQTYSKSEVNEIINNIHTFNALIVTSLPTQNISTTTIYLVAKSDTENNDYFDEYLYVNNSWEMIGNTKIDLSNYYNKTQIDEKLDGINSALSAKANKTYVDEIVSRETSNRENEISELQSDITTLNDEKADKSEIPTDYVNNTIFQQTNDALNSRIADEEKNRETSYNNLQSQITDLNNNKANNSDVVPNSGYKEILDTTEFVSGNSMTIVDGGNVTIVKGGITIGEEITERTQVDQGSVKTTNFVDVDGLLKEAIAEYKSQGINITDINGNSFNLSFPSKQGTFSTIENLLKAENGYVLFDSGLLIQWGYLGVVNNGVTPVSYPIAFSNAYDTAVFFQKMSDSGDTVHVCVRYVNRQTTGFELVANGQCGGKWLAVGYNNDLVLGVSDEILE